MKKYKGLFEFFSIATLCSVEPHLRFTIVLNASKDEIDKYLNDFILPCNVDLYPRQSDVSSFLDNADLLLNLSRPDECIETFGLTIIEGLAYGLPVIVPPVGGPAEIVRDKKEGFLCSCYEIEKIARLIITLSKNNKMYTKLSCNAKMRAKDFNYDVFEKGIAAIF